MMEGGGGEQDPLPPVLKREDQGQEGDVIIIKEGEDQNNQKNGNNGSGGLGGENGALKRKISDVEDTARDNNKGGKAPKLEDQGNNANANLANNGVNNYKQTKIDIMVQDQCCWKASKFLNTCRDCTHRGEDQSADDEICRFLQFRKLKRTLEKDLRVMKTKYWSLFDGFCDPMEDSSEGHLAIWMPNPASPPKELELDVCIRLLTQLGDQLCQLFAVERKALEIDKSLEGLEPRPPVAWKRLVEGVRETCDVCVTTLFNYHWICQDCGFVACLDCFKAKIDGKKKTKSQWDKEKAARIKAEDRAKNDKDEYGWLTCIGEKVKIKIHEVQNMRLTQLIPRNCMEEFNETLHRIRGEWGIIQECECPLASKYSKVAAKVDLKSVLDKSQSQVEITNDKKSEAPEEDEDDYAFAFEEVKETPSGGGDTVEPPPAKQETPIVNDEDEDEYGYVGDLEETVKTEDTKDRSNPNGNTGQQSDQNPNPRKPGRGNFHVKEVEPITCRFAETVSMYPGMPHSWLCQGQVLKLDDPDHPLNVKVFTEVWRRGQPVLVSNVGKRLAQDLWTPEAFMRKYGQQKNDLINCLTGKIVPDQPTETFWKGFLDVSYQLHDESGRPMLLKLKDWPPTEDFAKFDKERFEDLMKSLPLKDYTQRDGKFNLAARLPSSFVRPDLGPKMYIAYGDNKNLEKGTTVLHLDMSDAVNVMVYVGIPENGDPQHKEAVIQAVKESGCDQRIIERVTKGGELPGALWHIYRPWDANKIRDLINKVLVEQGKALEPTNDPIHDQVVYLDKALRKRLREEYNVHGYPMIQCEGDAVFIPAGAPHQVRNLHNCIKIAEDFVSPENVSHCFQLTEEFRELSDTHTNHEDKLQIKNIVYHAVKDAMSVLMHNANK